MVGKDKRPDNGIDYHSTIKFFDKEGDSPEHAHEAASKLEHQHIDPKKVGLEPKVLKDRNGNDVYALGLTGHHADKLKEQHEKFGHMGHPENYRWGAHISVPKAVHDEIKAKGHKTAHEAGIEFGPAELRRGPKILHTYHPKMKKSENPMEETDHLQEDEDAHALLNRQEDKYFLPKKNIEQVIETLSDRLALGDIDTDTRYNTNRTIYLDDKDLNTFHDCMLKKKPRLKVRIRQYSPNSLGWEEVAYAEFKMKEEDGFTKKIRVRIPAQDVDGLCNGGQILVDETLVNINKDIDRRSLEARVKAINSIISRRGLKKQLEVRYERRAYTGKNIRITIDENLRYQDAKAIDANVKNVLENDKKWKKFSEPYILAAWENPFILEVKSDKGVPNWLESLLKDVDAKEASFSKYCAAVLNQIKTDKESGDVLGTVGYLASVQELGKSEECEAPPLTKPYSSDAQRRWAHTAAGTKALGGKAHVHEWDESTKGKNLPEHVHKSESKDVDIAVVVLKDGNFILVGKRRRNKKWGLPGGRNEGKGESNEACVLRELEEEAGIKLKLEDLSLEGVREIKAGGENKRVHVYTAKFPGGEPTTKNDPDEEFTKWRWMRCEDGQLPDEILDDEMTPPAEAAFDELDMTKNETLEKGWKEKAAGAMMGLAAAAPHPVKADYRHVNAYLDSMKNIPGLKVQTQLSPGMSRGKLSYGKFNINTSDMLGGKSPISNHQIRLTGPDKKTWSPQDASDYGNAQYIYQHLNEKMPQLMEMTGPVKKSEFVESLEKGALKNILTAGMMAGTLASPHMTAAKTPSQPPLHPKVSDLHL